MMFSCLNISWLLLQAPKRENNRPLHLTKAPEHMTHSSAVALNAWGLVSSLLVCLFHGPTLSQVSEVSGSCPLFFLIPHCSDSRSGIYIFLEEWRDSII